MNSSEPLILIPRYPTVSRLIDAFAGGRPDRAVEERARRAKANRTPALKAAAHSAATAWTKSRSASCVGFVGRSSSPT